MELGFGVKQFDFRRERGRRDVSSSIKFFSYPGPWDGPSRELSALPMNGNQRVSIMEEESSGIPTGIFMLSGTAEQRYPPLLLAVDVTSITAIPQSKQPSLPPWQTRLPG